MAESPTQRTLRYIRDRGGDAAVVERFMKPPGMKFGWRVDLFNFGDVVAILDGKIWIIQCTDASNVSKRMVKVGSIPESKRWADTDNPVEVWGWSKRGPRGKVKRWAVKRVRLESFIPRVKRIGDVVGPPREYRWRDDLPALVRVGADGKPSSRIKRTLPESSSPEDDEKVPF